MSTALAEDGGEPWRLRLGGRRERLWAVVAATWALVVFAGFFSVVPLEGESEIERRWVVAKLELMEEYYGHGPRGESLAVKRDRLYGDASDEEIIRSNDAPAGAGDHAARVPTDRVRNIEIEYDGQLWLIHHKALLFGIAFACWLVPVGALFFFAKVIGTGEPGPPTRRARILGRLTAIVIAGFYLMQALGWAIACYAVSSGLLGKMDPRFEAAWQSLGPLDHAVRVIQVVTISMASALLVLGKRAALPLVLATIVFGTLTTFAVPQWSISFLTGGAVVLLLFVAGYVYWLGRRGLLR